MTACFGIITNGDTTGRHCTCPDGDIAINIVAVRRTCCSSGTDGNAALADRLAAVADSDGIILRRLCAIADSCRFKAPCGRIDAGCQGVSACGTVIIVIRASVLFAAVNTVVMRSHVIDLRIDVGNGVCVLAYFIGHAVELAAVYGIGASAGDIAGCYVDDLTFPALSTDTDHAYRAGACEAAVFTCSAVGEGNGALRFIRSGPIGRSAAKDDTVMLGCRNVAAQDKRIYLGYIIAYAYGSRTCSAYHVGIPYSRRGDCSRLVAYAQGR